MSPERKVIWYISKYASPEKYFFGTRHFYLAEEWVKQGHDVTVFTSNSSHLSPDLPRFKGLSFREMINGIRTIWVNTLGSRSSSGVSRIISWFHFEWQLYRLFRSDKSIPRPDVVIVSSLSLLTVLNGILLKRKYKARFIFEVRDIWPLSAIELGGFSRNNPFIRFLAWIERLGYKHADVIVGTIPNLEEHVKEVYPAYRKCICIPQGFNPAFFENAVSLPDEFVQAHFSKPAFRIAYTGTLNINNPIDTLIEAARLLQHLPVQFCILGKGDQKERFIELAKDLKNIAFIDPIPKKQVHHFLRYIDVCYDSIVPSLGKFGASRNKWIDYMYASKPIICSHSGFRSMIDEAGCGSFVEYGNAAALADEIKKYYEMQPSQRQQTGENGRQYLFSNRTFSNLAAIYESCF